MLDKAGQRARRTKGVCRLCGVLCDLVRGQDLCLEHYLDLTRPRRRPAKNREG
jgi:hypothetical protein